jgi:torulene dioxygenase
MLQTFGDFRQYRIVLDDTPSASYRTLVKNAEFSRIHPAYQFKPYRYVYFNYVDPGRVDEKGEMYGIKKFDLTAQQEIVWTPDTKDAYVCSEPVFIPRPESVDEDDGVVLSLVNVFANQGPEEDHCYMLVLDAKDFKEWGRVPLGKFTATTFHGSFVDHEFISTTYN